MKRIIVVDSCAELNQEMIDQKNVKKVYFHINIDDKHFLADDNVDPGELIKMMKNSKNVTRTAAPSPEAYYNAAKGYDEVYFVTISGKLSASYNSAMIAKSMLEEENPKIKIYGFDSKSSACGESQVVAEIQKRINENKEFEEIVDIVQQKINNMQTVFVLEDLDNLIKNGRMSKVAGFVASALSIYPVCIAVDGEIQVKHKPRGIKNALNRIVKTIGELVDDFENRELYITYIRNKERALNIKEKALQLYNFKDVKIFEGSALSTVYANNNGIILTF